MRVQILWASSPGGACARCTTAGNWVAASCSCAGRQSAMPARLLRLAPSAPGNNHPLPTHGVLAGLPCIAVANCTCCCHCWWQHTVVRLDKHMVASCKVTHTGCNDQGVEHLVKAKAHGPGVRAAQCIHKRSQCVQYTTSSDLHSHNTQQCRSTTVLPVSTVGQAHTPTNIQVAKQAMTPFVLPTRCVHCNLPCNVWQLQCWPLPLSRRNTCPYCWLHSAPAHSPG